MARTLIEKQDFTVIDVVAFEPVGIQLQTGDNFPHELFRLPSTFL